MLGSFQKRRLDGRRNVDRDEAIRREQVILAALVDDAEIAIPLGILVGQDDVDFIALERGLVAVVVHADSKLPTRYSPLAWPSRGTSYA
jgi:hypothetical protein